jgi:hypothetical protein
VDVVLIRLLAVALALLGAGAGVVAYLVAWIVIPKDRPAYPVAGPPAATPPPATPPAATPPTATPPAAASGS